MKMPCKDCGKETNNNENYYMIKDELWIKIHGDIDGNIHYLFGFLCITCLNNRFLIYLRRQLTIDDFPDFPINQIIRNNNYVN